MEQWASNTLRVLGIVVTAVVLLLGGFVLLLLSICAWGGGFGGGANKDQAFAYIAGLIVLLVLGIFVIAKLAKGIAQTTGTLNPSAVFVAADAPQGQVPTHLSPASQQAIHFLIYAIVAGLIFSALHTLLSVGASSITFFPYSRNAVPATILSFLLYETPYAVLLVVLARKPDRRAFAYAFAIPMVLLIQTLYTLPFSLRLYLRGPVSFVFLGIALVVECLILWLAWRANQHLGYRHDASSLLVAGVVVFLYFAVVRHVAVPLLYRWR